MTVHQIQLFGSFRATYAGRDIRLAPESQRLAAFLSVRRWRLPRPYVAGTLWSNKPERHALASLRSVLWRLRKVAPRLIDADVQTLGLSAETSTDIDLVVDRARQLTVLNDPHSDLDYRPLAREFLPGWYDEWVVHERERMNQLCMHALEAIAEDLVARREFPTAIQVLLSVISLDPLRESPRRQLLAVHLAEGNASEAVRHYDEYASILQDELGLRPSSTMHDMLRPRRPERSIAARTLHLTVDRGTPPARIIRARVPRDRARSS